MSRSSPMDPPRWSNRVDERRHSVSQSYDKENDRALPYTDMHGQLATSSTLPGLSAHLSAKSDLNLATPAIVQGIQPNKTDLFSPSHLSPAIPAPSSSPHLTVKQEPLPDADALAAPTNSCSHSQDAVAPRTLSRADPTITPSLSHVSNALNAESDESPWNLDALTESPEKVIFMLGKKAVSATDRGKWMTVAAHYRMRGNIPSAIAVVSAMIHGELGILPLLVYSHIHIETSCQ